MTTHQHLPEGTVDCRHFSQMIGGDMEVFWMQVLPVSKAVLRTPVMKESCL